MPFFGVTCETPLVVEGLATPATPIGLLSGVDPYVVRKLSLPKFLIDLSANRTAHRLTALHVCWIGGGPEHL